MCCLLMRLFNHVFVKWISLGLSVEPNPLPQDHLPVCPPLLSGAVNEKAWADTIGRRWVSLCCSFTLGHLTVSVYFCLFFFAVKVDVC